MIAAEAANNAMVGPSLVPLLTLSIPGSPTAAVLLGGLLIHGIFPGSDLFDNHPKIAWTFINSMLIGQILMVIFGIYTAAWAARIARAPQPIMAAAVMVLAVFGSYSVQQSMGDVFVMFFLGVGMYFLQKFGFSAAPAGARPHSGADRGGQFHPGLDDRQCPGRTLDLLRNRPLERLPDRAGRRLGCLQLLVQHDGGPRTEPSGGGGMTAHRLQHVVPALVVLTLAAVVTWLSFTQQPSDAFLFPRLISVVFIALAVWNFLRAALGMAKVGGGVSMRVLINLTPGLVVMLVYVLFAARELGFYLASAIAFPRPSTRSTIRFRSPARRTGASGSSSPSFSWPSSTASSCCCSRCRPRRGIFF